MGFVGGCSPGCRRGSKPSAYYWRREPPYAFDYGASEVARCPNEPALPDTVNDRWHEMLKKVAPDSPWQYYQLNVVQWLTPEGQARPLNNDRDRVSIARNSVLETYLLGDQSLAAQVPAVAPLTTGYSGEVGSNNPQSTLAALILQTIKTASQPQTTGPNTWSSCVLCHQLAQATFKEQTRRVVKTIPTDNVFLFQAFLDPPLFPPGSKDCPDDDWPGWDRR